MNFEFGFLNYFGILILKFCGQNVFSNLRRLFCCNNNKSASGFRKRGFPQNGLKISAIILDFGILWWGRSQFGSSLISPAHESNSNFKRGEREEGARDSRVLLPSLRLPPLSLLLPSFSDQNSPEEDICPHPPASPSSRTSTNSTSTEASRTPTRTPT